MVNRENINIAIFTLFNVQLSRGKDFHCAVQPSLRAFSSPYSAAPDPEQASPPTPGIHSSTCSSGIGYYTKGNISLFVTGLCCDQSS